MSVLKSLLDTYDVCIENNLVDQHNGNNTVLLPLYHTNLRSTGENILNIRLNEKSELINVEFLQKDQYIVFPVTIDSGSRTSSPCAHPLIDQVAYCFDGEPKKHLLYVEAFEELKNYINDGREGEFLCILQKFMDADNVFETIIDKLFGTTKHERKSTYKFEYETDKNKLKTIDFEKVFVHFVLAGFDQGKDVSVTDYVGLHRRYVEYVESTLEENGICNISGKKDFIVDKHRGLMGNAKVISVSNQKETYYGRFNDGSDIINIGYNTSEKIHLMLKYLLENRNSSTHLEDGQYFINWFKEDVSNDVGIALTESMDLFDDMGEEFIVSDGNTKDNATSFRVGLNKVDEDWNYYAMIVDKASNGRISIKYYTELKGSNLISNLEKWADKYKWERYDSKQKKMILYQPAFYELLNGAYGIDRNGRLILDNSSFKKDQYEKFITRLLEGKGLPENIVNSYRNNIKHRMKYNKSWKYMLNLAMAVLSEDRKEYMNMIPIEEQSRSYLYGRLLAIYENMEMAVFDQQIDRVTNAEKFWTSYNNKPATIMMTLENNIKPYERKLKLSEGKKGIYYKMKSEKDLIINEIGGRGYNDLKIDKSLDYEFIFGYYAERKYLFTRKNKEEN